jgi:hypothetical protein
MVGFADRGGGDHAFLWDATHGMRRLLHVMQAEGVCNFGGWQSDSVS